MGISGLLTSSPVNGIRRHDHFRIVMPRLDLWTAFCLVAGPSQTRAWYQIADSARSNPRLAADCRYRCPMSTDFSTQSLRDLLVTHVAVLQEITRRGLTRTRGSLAGELGERITLAAYGGELATAGTKSIDLIGSDGRTIQVKTRALDPGVNRIFAFSSFDFDVLVAIMLDATTFDLQWARELTSDEAAGIARYRVPSRDWAIATGKVKRSGVDVTRRLVKAYNDLG